MAALTLSLIKSAMSLRSLCWRGVASALALALLACTPRYDWREVRAGGAEVLLPAKPQNQTRAVNLSATSVDMTMHAARIGDESYAYSWVAVPPAEAAASLAAMRAALLRNIDGRLIASRVVAMARTESGATPLAGEEIEATGHIGASAVVLHARLAYRAGHVWQFAVYGPQAELASATGRQAIETFLLSAKVD